MAPAEAAEELEIHACGPADRAAQAALYERCFEKSDGTTVVPWRYDGNPHGEAISLLARDASGENVSGYACSPRIVLHGGEELDRSVVGQTGDVMTHPDHRGRGIFSRLDARLQSVGLL